MTGFSRDVYGSSAHSVDALEELVAAALEVTFVQRYGDYHGGEYSTVALPDGGELSIERNELAMFTPVEQSEDEFPEVDTVLYVHGPAQFDDIYTRLQSIDGLRHLYRTCHLESAEAHPSESQRTDIDVRVSRLGSG